jgi:hypothetical protein
MGIRFYCPNGHKLNVKEFQAGKRGICPHCGVKILIPMESTRPASSSAREPVESGEPDESSDDNVAETEVADAPAMATPPPIPGDEIPASVSPSPVEPEEPLNDWEIPLDTPEEETPPAPAGPDAIAQSPDKIWYVRPKSGGQFGPAAGNVMRDWLADGRVSADSLVWQEGWRDWEEAGKVFPQLRGSPIGFLDASPKPAHHAAPHGRRTHARRHSDGTRLTIVLLLGIAVFLLIATFLWVLFRP